MYPPTPTDVLEQTLRPPYARDNQLIPYQHGQTSIVGLTANVHIKAAIAGIQLPVIKMMQHWKTSKMGVLLDATDDVGQYNVKKIVLIEIFY